VYGFGTLRSLFVDL